MTENHDREDSTTASTIRAAALPNVKGPGGHILRSRACSRCSWTCSSTDSTRYPATVAALHGIISAGGVPITAILTSRAELWASAAPIPRIAVENPVMHGHAKAIVGRGPDQCIQPYQFGHGETKRTSLPDATVTK